MTTSENKNQIYKCLAIGINYTNYQKYKLKGCYNDVISITRIISTYYKCPSKNIVRLIDGDMRYRPTKDNIILGIRWLLCARCNIDGFYTCLHQYPHKPGTNLSFHYSGHGLQVRDISGDEADNMDECIVPLDFIKKGYISDDYLYKNLCEPVPTNVSLYVTMDMCASETSLDLKYTGANGTSFTRNNKNDTTGNVIQISTSLDGKSSADMKFDNKFYGAGTFVLLEVLREYKYNISGNVLVEKMNEKLKNIYPQYCKLSYGRLEYDKNKRFYS